MERFGQYELMQRIGMGGMAEVFRARTLGEAGFVKHVVIKRILPHLVDDDAFIKAFMDEARIAAKLTHANIVQVFDFQQQSGTFYIAMELVEGLSLDKIIRRSLEQDKAIGLNRAVQIAIGMCRGLGYAHERADEGVPMGIVHRDVSPHNVMISLLGEVKVADFGIAKAAIRATHTDTGAIKGKVPYMAPEHAQGESIDVRADIFSTGIVLWEMIAQRRMYEGDNEMQLLRRAMAGDFQRLETVVAGLPPSLCSVVAKLLAIDRDERFATMRLATRELEAVLHELGGAMAAPLDEYMNEILPKDLQASLVSSSEAPTDPEQRRTKELGARQASTAETAALARAAAKTEAPPAAPARALLTATSITQPEKSPRWRAVTTLLAIFALATLAWGITRTEPEVHQVLTAEVPAAASLQAATLPLAPPPEVAKPAEIMTPEPTAKVKPSAKKELGVVLFSCPVGSRVFDKGVLIDTLTERNRSRFTLPVGTHSISVRTPEGKLTKARVVTASHDFSGQYDCD